MKSKKIELLAPAGSPEALDAAIGEGADSIYLGLKDFNARIRAKNFSYNQLEAIVDRLHGLDKKVYVTTNIVFEEREAKNIYNYLKYLMLIGVDAVIVQDTGVIELARNFLPALKIHASTQMNISSAAGVNFLSRQGVKRTILSRELNLEQIKAITAQTGSEIEVFVHGALCISVSGLCLFSSYFGGKSANRGRCIQACRRLYNTENNKQGYFFSPDDLMLIEHVPDLIDAGVNSLKIEGRMKSYQYIATVVRAYRHMIDNYSADQEKALAEAQEILKNDFARPKTQYLFLDKDNLDFISSKKSGETGIFLGKLQDIKAIDGIQMGALTSSPAVNGIEKNDLIRFHSKDDLKRKSSKIKNIIKKNNSTYINIPEDFNTDDQVYLIQKGVFDKKYLKIVPNNLKDYKKHPGSSPVPAIKMADMKNNSLKAGLYVKINELKQFYILQALKPQMVIVHLSPDDSKYLIKTMQNTNFKPADIILYLEPVFFQEDDAWLRKELDFYIEKGFRNFIVNNYGQINILKNKGLNLLAGPYLYSFNKYAINFLIKNHCNYIINPIENNKRNLYLSSENFKRQNWLIAVFSFPELFQIRARLNKKYSFKTINDNINDYDFYLINKGLKTSLMPEKPFSITDKIPDLRKKGFNKFIIDLAFMETKKNAYKKIMRFADEGKIIEETTRFNWKDGFFTERIPQAPGKNK